MGSAHAVTTHFAVGRAGHFSGDDGTGGHVASSLHYACRMAAQLDTTLACGSLGGLHAHGTRAISAHVSWGMNGECLVQAATRSDTASTLSLSRIPETGITTEDPAEAVWIRAHAQTVSSAHVDAAVRAAHTATAASWTVLFDADLRPERLFGDAPSGALGVIASRCQGVLRGLSLSGISLVQLTYASGSLIIVPLTHGTPQARTLVAFVPPAPSDDDEALVETLRTALLTAPVPASTTPVTVRREVADSRLAEILEDHEPWSMRLRRSRAS